MLINILIGFVVLVVLFVVVVSLRPSEFRVARSASMGAPPDVVFPHVNNLHNWEAWSPWAKLDPAAKTTYEGPSSGVGAVFGWSGNNKIGEGRMTILESRPNDLVRFRLEFFRPFKGTNTAEFTFEPKGSQTLVTWTMFGPNSFMGKAVGLFIDCEKMCGNQFEQGLAQLNSVSGSLVKS
jgi:hypothetical protein